MNEYAAKSAVYTVINNARATLVGGLVQNEAARDVKHLVKTMLDTPAEYFGIGIDCKSALEFSNPSAETSTNPNVVEAWVEYSMVVRVFENAVPDTHGSFAEADENFGKLCDRIVQLIRQTTKWFPDSTSSPRFRLKIERDMAQVVRKNNDTLQPIQDGTYILGSSITFTLIDHCSDSSLLYP